MSTIFTLLFAGQFFISNIHQDGNPLAMRIYPPVANISEEVQISAESALVMEISSGMILYKKNIHERRAIASLTKLMTALVVLRESNIWESAEISENAYLVEGSKMHLLEGERIGVKDLLTALLVHSANDAAIALAEHVGKSLSDFIKMMNRRALYLGLKNTHFANPHGLDDPENYSTAFDIALLSKKILENDFVRATGEIRETTVLDTSGKIEHLLKTTNELLSSAFPIYGLKTGTTDAAGECFVGLVKVSKKEYLIVILGSHDRYLDTKALLWTLQQKSDAE